MNELLLAISLFFSSPELDLAKAKMYATSGDYIKSEEILNSYNYKKKYNTDYCYLKMVNAAFQNDKKETIKYSQLLLDNFDPIPLRYYSLAFALRNEAENWKDDDMDDISRNMRKSVVRLDNSYGGPETQKIQQKVLDQLEKKIKDLEDELKQQSEANAQQGDSENKGNGKKISQRGTPQDESKIQTDSGPGKVDNKKLINLAQNWGKMPPKERAKAQMELTRDLPPRYREIIEEYIRTIAKGEK